MGADVDLLWALVGELDSATLLAESEVRALLKSFSVGDDGSGDSSGDGSGDTTSSSGDGSGADVVKRMDTGGGGGAAAAAEGAGASEGSATTGSTPGCRASGRSLSAVAPCVEIALVMAFKKVFRHNCLSETYAMLQE
jgi:hypothetical protein